MVIFFNINSFTPEKHNNSPVFSGLVLNQFGFREKNGEKNTEFYPPHPGNIFKKPGVFFWGFRRDNTPGAPGRPA
ncbi:hypothetical protein, partial [Enterobacter hormaechei]